MKPNFWVEINKTESCKNSHGAMLCQFCVLWCCGVVLANVKYIHQQHACSGCSDDATKLWENIDDDVIVIVDDEEETEQ